MIPIRSARTKLLIAWPPKRYSASSVRTTVKLVMIERASVCRIEWLTISSNGSPACRARFSRIRSKTTIVSWTLNPMTVSMAVTNSASIASPTNVPRIAKIPTTMIRMIACRIRSDETTGPIVVSDACSAIGPSAAWSAVTISPPFPSVGSWVLPMAVPGEPDGAGDPDAPGDPLGAALGLGEALGLGLGVGDGVEDGDAEAAGATEPDAAADGAADGAADADGT